MKKPVEGRSIPDNIASNDTSIESIAKLIKTFPCENLYDYISLSSKLKQEISKKSISFNKTISIAILASSTINGIADILFVKCCSLGIFADVRIGGYNQYAQEILNPKSWLYNVQKDVVILSIDSLSLLGDNYLTPYAISSAIRRLLVETKVKEILSLVKMIKEHGTSKIILHNFQVPHLTVMGILESKQDFGLKESLETLNAKLREEFKYDKQVFLYDYDSFLSSLIISYPVKLV